MQSNARSEESIFAALLEIDTDEVRNAHLEAACGDDVALRRRVEALLRRHHESQAMLDVPPPGAVVTTDHLITERPGAVIGHYKLLQQIGEGGMGTVFLAEQTEPVQRKVALKVIKPGMDSERILVRFEAERQALAMMDHPNIAKVFDAGTTEPRALVSGSDESLTSVRGSLGSSGRPYFVMELVKGKPITNYCDEHHLTVNERLKLFVDVCKAVQHAHQKGIIHRDLKPSNIMVGQYDGKPVPKVIDFGVAKATGGKLSQKTLFTEFGSIIGTLEYMSPEQTELNQIDIDTRSDLYSLGVVLYELLTGSTPLDHQRVKEGQIFEFLQWIREGETPRPSTRVSTTEALQTIAEHRHVDPKKLCALMRGELDWIAMKALEKDRNRRYESANAFAADVERYLRNEPVQACPPSMRYRLGKFVRRNKVALGTVSVVAMALFIVFGITAWTIYDRAIRQRALQARVMGALEETDGWLGKSNWKEARSAVGRAVAALGDSKNRELHQAVQVRKADIALLKRLEQARLIRLELVRRTLNFEGAEREYENIFRKLGISPESIDPKTAASQLRQSKISLDLACALSYWALLRRASHDTNDPGWRRLLALANELDNNPTRVHFRRCYAEDRRADLVGLADSDGILKAPAVTLEYLNGILCQLKAEEEAIRLLRKARDKYPSDFWITYALAARLSLTKDHLEESYWLFQIGLALRGPHPILYNFMGTIRLDQQRHVEAEAWYRKAVMLKPHNAKLHYNLGNAYLNQGRLNEGEAEFREAIKLDNKDSWAICNLGTALQRQGRLPEAIAEFRRALKMDANDSIARNGLAGALCEMGEIGDAEEECREAIKRSPNYATAHATLGSILFRRRKFTEAMDACKQSLKLEKDHPTALINLGACFVQNREFDKAEDCFRKAIQRSPKDPLPHFNLATVLEDLNKPDEARHEYEKAIKMNKRFVPAYQNLAVLLQNQKQYTEAETLIKQAIRIDEKNPTLRQNLGNILSCQEKYALAIDAYAASIERKSNYIPARFSLAKLLLTCPDRQFQDGPRAARIMKETLVLVPGHRGFQDLLGLAHYRSGNWKAAVEQLERHGRLPQDFGLNDTAAAFTLAMAHYRLGEEKLAWKYYDAGAMVLAKTGNTDRVLLALKSEAGELLGSISPPPSKR